MIISTNSKINLSAFIIITVFNIATIALTILLNGIYILGIHNGYMEKPQVLPNLFKDIKEIFMTGLKFYGGFLLMYIFTVVLTLISFLILGIFCFVGKLISNVALAVCVIISIIIFIALFIAMLLLFSGLIFNYSKTLKLIDLINVEKAFNFIKACFKEFIIYIVKFIFLYIITTVAVFAVYFILIAATSVFDILKTIISNELQVIIILITTIIIGTMTMIFMQMDLVIQFLCSTKEKFPESLE